MPNEYYILFTISSQELSHDHLVGSPLSSSSSTLSLSPYVAPMPTANPTYNFALAGHTQLTFKDVMGKGNVLMYALCVVLICDHVYIVLTISGYL